MLMLKGANSLALGMEFACNQTSSIFNAETGRANRETVT